MDIEGAVTATTVVSKYFASAATTRESRGPAQMLFELEPDGTIRYSSIGLWAAESNLRPRVGSNLFEPPSIQGIGAFRRDFLNFVHGTRNRQTFQLRNETGGTEAVIILTRSFDRSDGGPPSEVVLMELRGS